ncbi:DUF1636 family protein [Marinibacterium profundimaris]|uniref:DUF1636 family protein n=1 Tax=Marinibacterium profundimaris TaxID=1679460 RepID=UPI000B5211B6|nr:DUF1636 domain-containing protein [Marinibacterium profundimaris]
MDDCSVLYKGETGGEPVDLLICTKCKMGLPVEDEADRPGVKLHAALRQAGLPDGVRLHAVECLSNCDHGCSVALRGGPKRWTYVYGNLDAQEASVETIVEGVTRYLDTENGLVPWRERPVHFRKNCIARIPPLELPE